MKTILWTIGGLIVGGFVGWQASKRFYEMENQAIINEYKEGVKKNNAVEAELMDVLDKLVESKDSKEDSKSEPERYIPTENEQTEYSDILNTNRYTNDTKMVYPDPYIIDENTFIYDHVDCDDGNVYSKETLMLFTDGILVYETRPSDDGIIPSEDMERIIGNQYHNRFGEYANETVFIRNERLRTDYEVYRESMTWYEYNNGNWVEYGDEEDCDE